MSTIALLAIAIMPALPATVRAGEGLQTLHLAQASQSPHITLAPTITAAAPSRIRLSIDIGHAQAPRHSFVRIRGVPPAISLSEGFAIAPGAWAVSLSGLPALYLNVPDGASGTSDLIVNLVAEDGTLLAEASSRLVIEGSSQQGGSLPAARVPDTASRPERTRNTLSQTSGLTPEDRERAEKLAARGEHDLSEGNVALARQFFLRAAEAGLARGALLLAATYDPRELTRLRVHGVQPNPAEARKWYERAQELGAPEAAERLARLGGE